MEVAGPFLEQQPAPGQISQGNGAVHPLQLAYPPALYFGSFQNLGEGG